MFICATCTLIITRIHGSSTNENHYISGRSQCPAIKKLNHSILSLSAGNEETGDQSASESIPSACNVILCSLLVDISSVAQTTRRRMLSVNTHKA
jgi:hypothetical protein